jgi:hypothetical protein
MKLGLQQLRASALWPICPRGGNDGARFKNTLPRRHVALLQPPTFSPEFKTSATN